VSCDGPFCYYAGVINTALSTPGAYFTSPADGTIASWRVHGVLVSGGVIRLLVAHPEAGGTFRAVASSLPALSANGTTPSPGSAALQVRAGDANVEAYLGRLMERPSFARVVEEAKPYRPLFLFPK